MFQRLHAVTGGSDYGPRNRRPNISSRLWQILLEIHAATATAASQSPQRCPSAHAADRERQLPANTETTTPQQSVHSQAVTLHSRASITACSGQREDQSGSSRSRLLSSRAGPGFQAAIQVDARLRCSGVSGVVASLEVCRAIEGGHMSQTDTVRTVVEVDPKQTKQTRLHPCEKTLRRNFGALGPFSCWSAHTPFPRIPPASTS